jgi:hypothetical protein
MTQSEVITILNNFQLKFDVNNIKYNNKAVWPIIRYYMAYTLLKPKSNNIEDDKTSSNLVKNKMGFFISRIFLKLYKLIALFEWPILYIKLQKQKSVFNKSIKKCLFVSPFNELYPDVIDGKKYSRYLDPYYELFQKKEPIAIPLPTTDRVEIGQRLVILEKGSLFGVQGFVSQKDKGRGRIILSVAG